MKKRCPFTVHLQCEPQSQNISSASHKRDMSRAPSGADAVDFFRMIPSLYTTQISISHPTHISLALPYTHAHFTHISRSRKRPARYRVRDHFQTLAMDGQSSDPRRQSSRSPGTVLPIYFSSSFPFFFPFVSFLFYFSSFLFFLHAPTVRTYARSLANASPALNFASWAADGG